MVSGFIGDWQGVLVLRGQKGKGGIRGIGSS